MLIVKNARIKVNQLEKLGFVCFFPSVKKSASKIIYPYGNMLFVEASSFDEEEALLVLKKEGFKVQMNGKEPYRLSEEEEAMIRTTSVEISEPLFLVDSKVKIIDGLFKDCKGVILSRVDEDKVKVNLRLQTSSFTVILFLNQLERV